MKLILPLLLLTTLLAGCGQPIHPGTEPENSPDTAKIEAVLNTSVQPEFFQKISEAKAAAKKGDLLTLQGKIMGSAQPFVEGRAAFTMGDPDLLISCDLVEGDSCGTPWDNCCEDPKLILEQTVLVQIVDDQGIVLRAPIRGVKGISELSRVQVTGKVDADPVNGVLILNASAMEVLK